MYKSLFDFPLSSEDVVILLKSCSALRHAPLILCDRYILSKGFIGKCWEPGKFDEVIKQHVEHIKLPLNKAEPPKPTEGAKSARKGKKGAKHGKKVEIPEKFPAPAAATVDFTLPDSKVRECLRMWYADCNLPEEIITAFALHLRPVLREKCKQKAEEMVRTAVVAEGKSLREISKQFAALYENIQLFQISCDYFKGILRTTLYDA